RIGASRRCRSTCEDQKSKHAAPHGAHRTVRLAAGSRSIRPKLLRPKTAVLDRAADARVSPFWHAQAACPGRQSRRGKRSTPACSAQSRGRLEAVRSHGAGCVARACSYWRAGFAGRAIPLARTTSAPTIEGAPNQDEVLVRLSGGGGTDPGARRAP